MTSENKDEEAVEIPPETKPKPTLLIGLSVLIGVLLTLTIGGTIYHVQSKKALVEELATAKDELQRKTLLLAESQEQIVGLSRQMHALREFSVAKASEAAAAASSEPAAAPTSSPPARIEREATKLKPAGTPVAKTVKPAEQDCQLVGKSQEEQAATLKRCMQGMERR